MKKSLFLWMILVLIFCPITRVSASAAPASLNITFEVVGMRETYGMPTDFDAPLGGSSHHLAFYVQCHGAASVSLKITHTSSQFNLSNISPMQCGSIYFVNGDFTPRAAGLVIDEVTFSGEFGTVTKELIGNGVPLETPEYSILDLGPRTSARRMVYDDQRDLLYITDAGNHQVIVFSPAQNQITNRINVGKSPVGLSLTSDYHKLYVTNSGEYSVSVVNLNSQASIASIDVSALQFSPYEIAVINDQFALIGTVTKGFSSEPRIHQLNLVTRELTLWPKLLNSGLGSYPVMRTSRDFSATGILVEPASSPTQLVRYDRKNDAARETMYGLERTVGINNNGTRLISTSHDCNILIPDLTVYNQEFTRQGNIQLLGCQSIAVAINPVNPNYVYSTDSWENVVDVASLSLGIELKRLQLNILDF